MKFMLTKTKVIITILLTFVFLLNISVYASTVEYAKLNAIQEYESGGKDIFPGEVLVGTWETTRVEFFIVTFPELNIEMTEDTYEALRNYLVDTPLDELDKIAPLGMYFKLTLNDKSKDSVLNAIEILIRHPLIKYATPNYIFEPHVPNEMEYKIIYRTTQGEAIPGLVNETILVDVPGQYTVKADKLPRVYENGKDTYLLQSGQNFTVEVRDGGNASITILYNLNPYYDESKYPKEYMPGEIVVGMKDSTGLIDFFNEYPDLKVLSVKNINEAFKEKFPKTIYQIKTGLQNKVSLIAAMEIISSNPFVEYTHLNVIMSLGEPENTNFMPGEVMVGTLQSVSAEYFIEAFPELAIDTAEDLNESLRFSLTDVPLDVLDRIAPLGVYFRLTLKENSKEKVLYAVELISRHPLVEYAQPNYIIQKPDLPKNEMEYKIIYRTTQGEAIPGLVNETILVGVPGQYTVEADKLPRVYENGKDTYLLQSGQNLTVEVKDGGNASITIFYNLNPYYDESKYPKEYMPGEIVVGMRDSAGLFDFFNEYPDLKVLSVIDINEAFKEKFPKTVYQIKTGLQNKVSLIAAMEIISSNPFVECTHLNVIMSLGEPENTNFMPGEVIVGTLQSVSAEYFITAFPELAIEKVVDSNELIRNSLNEPLDTLDKTAPLGRYFILIFNNKSVENVFHVIDVLIRHPIIEYARPNYLSEPNFPDEDNNKESSGNNKINFNGIFQSILKRIFSILALR